MREYPKLKVEWNDKESAEYFINQISCGWNKQEKTYWLKSFSGTYKFDPITKQVSLFDGIKTKNCNVKEWHIKITYL